LVSPWYPHGDINNYLEKNPKADHYKLIRGVCNGLINLHDNKIVHGNIKPANILVDSDGKAVLCDYGLQTLLCDFPITIHFQSVRYTAPEHRRSCNGVFQGSKEGDIWAFGCVSIEV
ncbi:kinase-like domain-containing protein, partial [Cantharellus anzutake]|uniref:kinase-like domain-containing protein n=1 Tax=Cantharellus anzutake TaxID=1750568 RepID=UPI00190874CC